VNYLLTLFVFLFFFVFFVFFIFFCFFCFFLIGRIIDFDKVSCNNRNNSHGLVEQTEQKNYHFANFIIVNEILIFKDRRISPAVKCTPIGRSR